MSGFTVYRFIASTGEPLYVGRSCRLPRRLHEHRKDKAWWTQAARIELEHFETEGDMLQREADLIRELRPAYNIALMPNDLLLELPAPEINESPYITFEQYHDFEAAAKRYRVTEGRIGQWISRGMPHWRIADMLRVRFSETDPWVQRRPKQTA